MRTSWRKRRASERGAAVAESILMLPVLFGALAVTFWGWHVYEDRLLGMKSMRSDIYRAAQIGCDQRGPSPRFDGVDLSVIDRAIPNGPGTEILKNVIAEHENKIAKVIVASGAAYGTKAESKARVMMTCNEVPRDGQPRIFKNLSSTSFDPRSH